MQIAHPLVAAGVADHSDFTARPFDRLWRTVDTALTVIFGDDERWREAAARVHDVHAGVSGSRHDAAYSALDPALLLWVHATLVDSSIEAYATFVRPLPAEIRARYYLEMRRMGSAFGVPEHLHPPTYPDLRAYLRETIASLRPGEESRRLARHVLEPSAPLAMTPLVRLGALAAVGLTPPPIRAGLGLRWGPGAEMAFRSAAATIRRSLPLVPARMRRWPHAREAEDRVAASTPFPFRPPAGVAAGPRPAPSAAPARSRRAGSGSSPRRSG
jgi:uncharacterized protein (DUF2236 family)